jgi:hypothetical protein
MQPAQFNSQFMDIQGNPPAVLLGITMTDVVKNGAHGYLSGRNLMGDLAGQNGNVMRSVATGYIMGIYDSMIELREPLARANAEDRARTLLQVAACVESWLAEHPSRVEENAASLIRAALREAGFAGASEPDASLPRQRLVKIRWSASAVAICSIATVFGLCGLTYRMYVSDHTVQPLMENVKRMESAEDITNLVLETRRYEKDAFLNMEDPVRFDMYSNKWGRSRAALSMAIGRMSALDLTASDRQALRDLSDDLQEYSKGCDQILSSIRRAQIRTPQDANVVFAQFKKAAQRMEVNGESLTARANERMGVIG